MDATPNNPNNNSQESKPTQTSHPSPQSNAAQALDLNNSIVVSIENDVLQRFTDVKSALQFYMITGGDLLSSRDLSNKLCPLINKSSISAVSFSLRFTQID